jgi:pimeloyl-ACP methyl ester carboxylesterase
LVDDSAPAWFREALAAPVIDGQLDVDGCHIAFRQWGDPSSPGLLLVHGGGAHSRWWDHVAPFFRGDCCVTAVDLSGHGDSGRRPVYTFENWSKEIAAVAANTAANPAPPVILAHSLGGLATFCAAASYGDDFEGIIVIDSPVYSLAPEQQASRNREAFGPLRKYPSREAGLARFRTVPDQPVMLPYVVEHIKEHSLRRSEDGWTWKFDPKFFDNVGHVGHETLAAIPCRVAVLRAEQGLVTEDIGQQMYQALGHTAPVIEIPLAYHHVMLDQPIALVTAVRSLLADWRHSYSIRAAG